MKILTLFLPLFLQAHMLDEKFGDYYSGVAHPLTALEHILPMIALSLLIVSQRKRLINSQKELTVFWFFLAVGGLFALFIKLPFIYFFNIFSAILFGILLALSWQIPKKLFFVIIAFFGFTHGFANGEAMGENRVFYYFISGMLIAVMILMLYIVGMGDFLLKQKQEWIKIAIRVVGSWIAAIGILVLSLSDVLGQ